MARYMDYDVNDNGVVTSPGKFEGEPSYVVHFWDGYMNGMCDEDDGETVTFILEDADFEEFPALRTFQKIDLWEDSQGFVHHSLSTSARKGSK